MHRKTCFNAPEEKSFTLDRTIVYERKFSLMASGVKHKKYYWTWNVGCVVLMQTKVNDLYVFCVIFTGLFDTITSTSKSKDCPGRCVHVLAALLCEKVLENVTCSEGSMRCCVENRPSPPARSVTTKTPAVSTSSVVSSSSEATTTQVNAHLSLSMQ